MNRERRGKGVQKFHYVPVSVERKVLVLCLVYFFKYHKLEGFKLGSVSCVGSKYKHCREDACETEEIEPRFEIEVRVNTVKVKINFSFSEGSTIIFDDKSKGRDDGSFGVSPHRILIGQDTLSTPANQEYTWTGDCTDKITPLLRVDNRTHSLSSKGRKSSSPCISSSE